MGPALLIGSGGRIAPDHIAFDQGEFILRVPPTVLDFIHRLGNQVEAEATGFGVGFGRGHCLRRRAGLIKRSCLVYQANHEIPVPGSDIYLDSASTTVAVHQDIGYSLVYRESQIIECRRMDAKRRCGFSDKIPYSGKLPEIRIKVRQWLRRRYRECR